MPTISERLGAALAGRYLVERELGHGGMATVHLARDLKHDRAVAIKVLRPELAQAMGGERFTREITIASKLQSPHILPLLDSGEADGLLYYVMPLVDGESLRDLLARDGAMPPSEAMRLLREIVDGLAHAHRRGVLHRDIKPDNVMLAERHALLMDFGVAKALAEGRSSGGASGTADPHVTLTEVGISLGTPAYMAPEQAAADPNIDHRADIYAVGVMAYEMLTGAPPFTGTPQVVIASHITKAPAPLQAAVPGLSAAIAAIVMRCLAKDPADRFQTADDLLQAIEGVTTPSGTAAALPPAARRRRTALIGVGVIALAVAGFLGYQKSQRSAWVHQTALPELRRLIDAAENDSAFALALEIEAIEPNDSTLVASWPRFSRKAVFEVAPAGVKVYRASFADTSTWRYLGESPLDSVRLPSQAGLFRFEKVGHRTDYHVFASFGAEVLLESLDSPDSAMVRIPGGEFRAFLVGADGSPPVELKSYQMDRFEVSNREFKRFVDAGGYRDERYWDEPIRDGSRTLTLAEVQARFVDKTGRPGPASWEGGDYPTGQGDYPVGGVSWYEAAAYAKFAGKSLPTIYHWAHAAAVYRARFVVPFSNLEGSGPMPVGILRGVSEAGVSDMAGNVREWCRNESGVGQHFILGGGWTDPTYSFVDAYAQQALDRSPINGIRLVRYDTTDANVQVASAPIPRAFTDYDKETPVSDAVFAGFLPQFDYDPIALDAKVEVRDSTNEDWIAERVSFTTAYAGERMAAWIYIPRRGTKPYQTVVFYPGSGVINAGPSTGVIEPRMAHVVKSGRIGVVPILKSTYERADSLTSDVPTMSIFWRDHVVMWVKDYRRTLDYLSTRAEVDTTRFAYFGYSWGGYMGGIIPAVEPRLKASVLYVAGFTMERSRPEVDPLHYLPRVRLPVLMLNGKYDYFFPSATAQEPFFRRFGSPAADKKYIVYEGGHDVPRTELIKESLAWFDKYLGPVRP